MSQKPRTSKTRNLLILGLCLVGTAVVTQEGAVTGHATGGGAGGCGGDVQWDGDILYRDVDGSDYALTTTKQAEDDRSIEVEAIFSVQVDIEEAQAMVQNIDIIMASRLDDEEPATEIHLKGLIQVTVTPLGDGPPHDQYAWLADQYEGPAELSDDPDSATASSSSQQGLSGSGGTWNYCGYRHKCDHGQGDCDHNMHCNPPATCKNNVGAKYGWPSTMDVCERNEQPGSWNYCSSSSKCGHGEGDCDSNSHCKNGTVCVNNVGTNYGWAWSVDVCECPGEMCGDTCIDTQSDANNCGGCGNTCEDTDDNPCTVEGCSNGSCEVTQSLSNGTSCGDGMVCHFAQCVAACSEDDECGDTDNNPCTIEGCSNGSCQVTRSLSNGTSCGDGMNCHFAQCVASCSEQDECGDTDNNPCTIEGCSNGSCQVTHSLSNGTSCGDGMICRFAACVESCDDSSQCSDADNNPCTLEGCTNGACGVTQSLTNGAACGDGKVCDFAVCKTVCTDDDDCPSDNPCTRSGCSNGLCEVVQSLASGTPCGDNSACQMGQCVNNNPSHAEVILAQVNSALATLNDQTAALQSKINELSALTQGEANANTAKQVVALQADIQSIEADINHTRQVIESLLAQLPASIAADKQRELEDALP